MTGARRQAGSGKGIEMTSDEAPGAGSGTVDTAGPPPFDTSVAHQARVYDYMLGGKDNYAADRAAVEASLQIDPRSVWTARANRAFLGRAVRYLAVDAGIRQFLDIGTGIPTAGNTHEVAQAVAPESRVVYVDYDPVVLAHARALLTSHEAGATEYIDADLRDTGAILGQARQLLDFTRPVAVTLLAILHAIPDSADPYGMVARLMDAVPSGSYLAISQLGSDLYDPGALDRLKNIAIQMSRQEFAARSREQIARFFDGMDVVEPGLVRVEEWRPDPAASNPDPAASNPVSSSMWCALARKR